MPIDASTTMSTDASTTIPADDSTTIPSDASTTMPTDASSSMPTGASTTMPTGASTTMPTDDSKTMPADDFTTMTTDASTAIPTDDSTTRVVESSVDYNIRIFIFKALNKTSLIDDVFNSISDAMHAILENSTFDDLTITRENTTLRLLDEEIKEKNESKISQRLCTLGFLFDSTIFKCVSECKDFQTKCKNNGRCVLNIDGNPECRCREVADFVFTGQYCDIKIKKLALESRYIIAIATSIGCVLSVVIITTCFLYHIKRRQVKRTKTLEPADDEDNISQYRPSSVHRSMHASADLYSSVYKIYDDNLAEQKPEDLSSTMRTYKSWTTECNTRLSPWYKSNDIISGKEFTIKRPKIILYRASMYDC